MKPLSQAITYTMHRVQSCTVTVTCATVCNSPTCSFSPDQWLCWWGGRSWWARPAWLWASFRCTPAARPGNPDTGPARTARCRSMHCPSTLHTGKMGRGGGGEGKGGAHTKTDGQSEPTVLFHSSPPWKGTNYDNCSVSVSDRQYQAASHPWGDKEEEKGLTWCPPVERQRKYDNHNFRHRQY